MMNMDNLAARHVEDFKAAINVTPLWDDSCKLHALQRSGE